jgi:hypothetical protein
MQGQAETTERIGRLKREVNALIGLISLSVDRRYPEAIRGILEAMVRPRLDELDCLLSGQPQQYPPGDPR